MFGLSVATVVFALAFALLVGLYAHPIGSRLGLMDLPDGDRKRHARATPLVGGTAVVLAVVGATLLMQLATHSSAPTASAHLGWFAFVTFCMYLIGVTDDRVALRPTTRLALAGVVLLAALLSDPRFVLGTLQFTGAAPLDLGRFGIAFSLLCLLGLQNAVNMADGKNGLVISLCLIWSLVLAAHAPAYLVPVLAAGAAALAVMLWFNMQGRLFLGDGGSYGLSAIFGLLAIDLHNVAPDALRADHVAVMFAVPVLDTVRLISMRMRSGLSPFAADRNHLHHLLFDRWGWPKGLGVYVAMVGAPCALATAVPEAGPVAALLAAGGYVAVLAATRRPAPGRVPAE